MPRISNDRRGDGQLESVVQNDDLMLVERLLAFGTRKNRKEKKRANFMQMLREL